jgi:RNA polymerase sigma-70 factor (ECF subfamily)
LESLYSRYARRIFALAIKRLSDTRAAEEVTQDVFFNVWRRASSYRPQLGSVYSWLFTIANNRTIDELRRWRRIRNREKYDLELIEEPAIEDEDPFESAVSEFERNLIEIAFQNLKSEQRTGYRSVIFQRDDPIADIKKNGMASGNSQDEAASRDTKP